MSYRLIVIQKSGVGLIYFQNKLLSVVMEHSLYKVNDIYLGKISTILPSLDAAFVTLNPLSKNGFISFDQPKDKNQSYNRLNPIKINKNILVQITREPIGTKGPSVSCQISLMGKYLILLPFSQLISVTKKISNETDKDYIKAISNLLTNPNHIGIIAKSGIIQANINFLIKEIKILKSRWNISETEKKTVIEVHNSELDLIKYYLIDIILTEIMKPRVNLPKGGYIVIEKTEALTTIDVNSGSFTTLHNSRQTSLWVNYSAAYEIVKQIRLRNLGGIIIIDFIDSTSQVDQMKLLHYMSRLVKKDFVKCTIIQMSELGLVEMTRTRYGQSIYDAFSRRCVMCNGLGHLTLNLGIINHKNYELLLTNISRFNKISCKKIERLYS